MIAAILGVIALMEWQMSMTPAVVIGAVIFLIACALQIWFNRYSAAVYQREHARRDPLGDDRSPRPSSSRDLALRPSECQSV